MFDSTPSLLTGLSLLTVGVFASGCESGDPTGAQAPQDSPPTAFAEGPPPTALAGSGGLVRLSIPDEDPGPPMYARVTTIINQTFHDGDLLAIPFYRPPACVPQDFNLLDLFDMPGPGGPGAFACPLLTRGFLLIEPDAPLGTFPRQAVMTDGDVPFWFVDWETFQGEMADGVVTMADLEAMAPLKGVSTRYHETLRPREEDHLIVIRANGTLEDGRSFTFHVTHRGEETRALQIEIR